MLILFLCWGYNNIYGQDFVKGKALKVISTNSFLIEQSDSKTNFLVQLNDTKAISDNDKNYSKAINYLQDKILNKEIYFLIGKEEDGIVNVSIVYDCIVNDNQTLNNGLPCLSANYLDVEMIKKGYVRYIGSNEYLKKLANTNGNGG